MSFSLLLLCLHELAVLSPLFLIVLVIWPSTNVKRVSGPLGGVSVTATVSPQCFRVFSTGSVLMAVAHPLVWQSGSRHLGSAGCFCGEHLPELFYYYKLGFFKQQNIIFSHLWRLKV